MSENTNSMRRLDNVMNIINNKNIILISREEYDSAFQKTNEDCPTYVHKRKTFESFPGITVQTEECLLVKKDKISVQNLLTNLAIFIIASVVQEHQAPVEKIIFATKKELELSGNLTSHMAILNKKYFKNTRQNVSAESLSHRKTNT